MNASFEEVRLLLTKWRDERTPLLVGVTVTGVFVSILRSCIVDLPDKEIVFGTSAAPARARVLLDAATYEYVHPSEIPSLATTPIQHARTALIIRCTAGVTCNIIELPDSARTMPGFSDQAT